MKRLFLALCLAPTSLWAQWTVPDVKYAEPPTRLEIESQDPTNWILGGILIAVVVIGALLLRKRG